MEEQLLGLAEVYRSSCTDLGSSQQTEELIVLIVWKPVVVVKWEVVCSDLILKMSQKNDCGQCFQGF